MTSSRLIGRHEGAEYKREFLASKGGLLARSCREKVVAKLVDYVMVTQDLNPQPQDLNSIALTNIPPAYTWTDAVDESLVSASSELNLTDIESMSTLLDIDKEFDIPQVDTPPTLESILNETEDEDEPFVLEETSLLNAENIDTHSCETSSLASSDSGDRMFLKRRRRLTESSTTVHGSVLRHSTLKGVSAQIVSAADKVDAGLPTSVAVSNVIAVGTSHGLALVFGKDPNQALRLCLGSTALGGQYGAVSALSINNDCTRLLCGFAKGQITMWDLANGKLLRTITDAHPPGTAILHIKFTDDPTLAICNDSGGSVFELSFRRVMGMRTCESRCLFSGSKGEVCCIEPLHSKAELRDHPIAQYSLLAMASLTKILLIGLKPSLKVWMTFPYGKTDPASVPLLAWHFVAVQKSINPMLAFCRGDVVHFLLVKKEESGAIHVIKQKQLHLYYDIISLMWINTRTLVLLDSAEKIHVIDRPSQEELETLDIAEVQLIYNSSHFKSLATGGNVSQALALVGEKACYESVCSYGGQIVFLGTKSVHIMTLRSWRERVDHLLKQEKFVEALSLSWSFHEGTARAVVGLFGDPNKRKGVVADKMVEILLQYADRSLKKCPEQGKIQVMEQHFQDIVPIMVDYCLLLQRTDLLFSQIYSKMGENSVAKAVFLECLEHYILSDRLVGLTPHVMKDLLIHFQDNGMMDSIESCIVHMDITSLDIQWVVQLCWEHHLYDAMIYVYNSGMNDYLTPMEKLFQMIGPPLRAGKSLSDDKVTMGNKLLVYISCCLAGRAYPLGDIPDDLVGLVKNQVFEFLIRLHSPEASPDEEVYPYIRTLLHFDTREFLNVLALTFEDFKNDKQALEYQQRIVDILLKVMVENSDFTPSQVGCLFTFLARQLAKPNNTLFVNRKLFDQVLEFLCTPDDDSRHTERQQERWWAAKAMELQAAATHHDMKAFYDRLKAVYGPRDSGSVPVRSKDGSSLIMDWNKILESWVEHFQAVLNQESSFDESVLAEIPQWQIADILGIPSSEHEVLHAIKCMTSGNVPGVDSLVREVFKYGCHQLARKLTSDEVFSYIHNILSIPGHSPDEKQSVWEKTMEHIKELALIDPTKAADLVAIHFESEIPSIIDKLEENFLRLQFLRYLLDPREGNQNLKLIKLNSSFHECYLDLLCIFSHREVTEFLKLSEHYRLEEAIQITRKHNLNNATAYLLENKGDIHGAFQVLLQDLKKKLSLLTTCDAALKEDEDCLQSIEAALEEVIALCQRSSDHLNQEQREALWFPLLEAMMSPQKFLKESSSYNVSESLKQLTMQVMNSMTGFIALPSILQRILQDPVYGRGKLAEIKGLILGMLETFNYEQTLLETTNNLLNHDLHWSLSNLRAAVCRGLSPRLDHCSICLQQYKKRQELDEEIIVFSCGHLYHCQCLRSKDCNLQGERRSGWSCYKCTSNIKGSKLRERVAADTDKHKLSSLAQIKVTSVGNGGFGESRDKKVFSDVTLDAQQSQAFDQLCCIYRGSSRLAILTELSQSRGYEKSTRLSPSTSRSSGSVHQENFGLKLAPPPFAED
ncbi:vacuolar protein sorting-associated protein 8 homolog [Polypterus senegalus]|uniref:vacuolar protein sorting-associated protein 8 homolog n=1 Tax=Polypterus senegalus TaxID=55291 RepID=UPI00196470A8|nr:vacuolar protein sorting-associated protein 8 homolog [Polypterus senegalus]